MTDYERVAKVIRYLDKNREVQPSLARLANHIGLSPSYFHRLLSSWAGITPKDFLQGLTVAHARGSLLAGSSVLEAALDAGLSGPGRLHDLAVNLQAATPGEIKSGGDGWVIFAGYMNTPFGIALLAESPRGLCHLSFVEAEERSAAWQELLDQWPNAKVERDDKRAGDLCSEIFMKGQYSCCPQSPGTPTLLPLKLYVKGTVFQIQVWQALLQIPAGKLVSYGKLAVLVGNSKASRAVGGAVGRNPIGYLIPCHRVIREAGAIGGYRWGNTRKKAIQVWESGQMVEMPTNH